MRVHKRYRWAAWFKHQANIQLKKFDERLFWKIGMPDEPPEVDDFFSMYEMGGEL